MTVDPRFFVACGSLLCATQLTLGAQSAVALTANLSGANEVPPNGSTATGEAVFSYDTALNSLTGTLVVEGMNATAAHIHTGVAGTNGGILVPFTGGPSSWTVSTTLTQAQESTLLNQGFYVNVHSMQFPGGEIRDQVTTTYGGLRHSPLGQGQIEIDSNGKLRVSNLGSSGLDGVSIDLGEVEGFQILELDDMIPGTAPNGACSSWTCVGQVGGQPDRPLLTHRNEVTNGVVSTSVDFSAVGANQTHTQVFQDGILIAENFVATGSPSYTTTATCGYTYG